MTLPNPFALLPCPFCGTSPLLAPRSGRMVRCGTPGCPLSSHWIDRKPWNTRATPGAGGGDIGRVSAGYAYAAQLRAAGEEADANLVFRLASDLDAVTADRDALKRSEAYLIKSLSGAGAKDAGSSQGWRDALTAAAAIAAAAAVSCQEDGAAAAGFDLLGVVMGRLRFVYPKKDAAQLRALGETVIARAIMAARDVAENRER